MSDDGIFQAVPGARVNGLSVGLVPVDTVLVACVDVLIVSGRCSPGKGSNARGYGVGSTYELV